MKRGAALGFAVVAAHAAAFTLLAARCHGTDLSVDVATGAVPAALADRVEVDTDAQGPGLVRKRWVVRYRGGFERSVFAAQLVGPFQDPAAHACTGRVTLAQRLLDDGAAGPGTIAGQLAGVLGKELAGQEIVGAGAFRRVTGVALRWAGPPSDLLERAFVGDAPHGYVHAALRVEFDRVAIALTLALVPQPSTSELGFRVVTRAELDFGNRAFQWLSDKLGGDKLATKIAREHVDDALVSALAPPPPFELPGGQTLRFTYCDGPVDIVDGAYGAVPFAVAFGRAPDPAILPTKLGPAPHAAPTAALSIDLDLDALNAVLYELWRTGVLDGELAKAGLDKQFNEDPTVAQFLTLRISPLTLALPPVLAASPRGLRLAADGRVTITDRAQATTGYVWGGLDFAVGSAGLEPLQVDLGTLDLACARDEHVRVPCYADLVNAIRGRGDEFHGALTRAFTSLLTDMFVERRLAATGLPAEIVIRKAVPRITTAGNTSPQNASLQLGLDAVLVPTTIEQ